MRSCVMRLVLLRSPISELVGGLGVGVVDIECKGLKLATENVRYEGMSVELDVG